LPEELVAPAIQRETERRSTREGVESILTAREYEIAGLVAEGLSNKHIGRWLEISEGTVKIHLNHVYQKLAIPNRTALAVLMQNSQGLRRTYAA
jgi:two-component system nitrate/nitrite response regulator NarL